MAGVYPVGIPAAFSWWLSRHRRDLVKPTVDRSSIEHLEPLKDLWAPYKPKRYYFEMVEFIRRIALTRFAVFIWPNSAAQVAVILLLAAAFAMLSEALSPFIKPLDRWLYRSGTCVTFTGMYAALLLKVDVSQENTQSQAVFSGVLILAHVLTCSTVVAHAKFVTQQWGYGKNVFESDLPSAQNVTPTEGHSRGRATRTLAGFYTEEHQEEMT